MISSFIYPTYLGPNLVDGGSLNPTAPVQYVYDQDPNINQFEHVGGDNANNVNLVPYLYQEQIPLAKNDQYIINRNHHFTIAPERDDSQSYMTNTSYIEGVSNPNNMLNTLIPGQGALNNIDQNIQLDLFEDSQQGTWRNIHYPSHQAHQVQISQQQIHQQGIDTLVKTGDDDGSFQPPVSYPLLSFEQQHPSPELLTTSVISAAAPVYEHENGIKANETQPQQTQQPHQYNSDEEVIILSHDEDDEDTGSDENDTAFNTESQQKEVFINGYIQLTSSEIEEKIERVDSNYKRKLKLYSDGLQQDARTSKNGKHGRRSRFNKILTPCPIKSCPYKGLFQTCDYLKRHIREQHGRNARLYNCEGYHGEGKEGKWGCGKGFKRLYQLHNHWKGPRSLKKCNVPKEVLDVLE